MTTADAPTTEAIDAAMAATPAAGPSSPAAAPSPDPAGTPSPAGEASGDGAPTLEDYVENESLDIDGSDLPDATKKELRKLREQTKRYREEATPWKQATEGWSESDIDQLRQALSLGPTNPDAIGEWMLNSAKALLGDRFDELTGGDRTPDTPQVGDDDGNGGTLTVEDVKRIMAEERAAAEAEAAKAAQVQAIIDKTETLGFGPDHDLHFALLSLARNRTNGDLDAAAELLREQLGQDPNSAASPSVAAEAGHTPVASEGGTPAGTQRPSSPRAAAEERLSKVLGASKGFPAL